MCLFAYHLHFCYHTCQSAPAMSKSGSPLGNLGQRKKKKKARWSKVDETLMGLFLRQYFSKKHMVLSEYKQFECFNKHSFFQELFKSTFWELWFNFSLPWWFLQIIKLSWSNANYQTIFCGELSLRNSWHVWVLKTFLLMWAQQNERCLGNSKTQDC